MAMGKVVNGKTMWLDPATGQYSETKPGTQPKVATPPAGVPTTSTATPGSYSGTAPSFFDGGVTQVSKKVPTVGSAPTSTPSNLAGSRSEGWLNTGPAMPTGAKPYNPAIGTVSTATSGSNPNTPQLDPSIIAAMNQGSKGTQIDPNNSLRSQQFLPGSTGNQYDAQALAAYNSIPGIGGSQYNQQAADIYNSLSMPSEFSAQSQETRDMIMNALRAAQNGPDRNQMAKESYDLWQMQTEPEYQQNLRGVGQKAAALGRIGAGMTTNDLTGVMGTRTREQDILKRSLINDANQQILQDRINVADLMQRGSGTIEGQDLSRQQSVANLGLGRASGLSGLGANDVQAQIAASNAALQRASGLQGMGTNEWGRTQDVYNQNANERSYQDYLARTAVEDRIRQEEMQQQRAQQEWQNQYQSNLLAAQLAAQQNTGYPSIAQPQGDSYAAGQAAGAGVPTYTTGGGYTGSAPSFYEPSVQEPWTPPATNTGLGMQDPNTWGTTGDTSIFSGQGLGMQPNGGSNISPFARQRFGLE